MKLSSLRSGLAMPIRRVEAAEDVPAGHIRIKPGDPEIRWFVGGRAKTPTTQAEVLELQSLVEALIDSNLTDLDVYCPAPRVGGAGASVER